jgi:hypothetical protein
MRADVDRFGEVCEIWMRSYICEDVFVFVAVSIDPPAAKGELPCRRLGPSASLVLWVLRVILVRIKSSVWVWCETMRFHGARCQGLRD